MAKIFQTTFSNALFSGKTFVFCFVFCKCNLCDQVHDDVIKWKHFSRNWPWLSKQSRRRWFGTPTRSLWRQCNARTGGRWHVLSRPAHFSWIFYIDPSSSHHVLLRDHKIPEQLRVLGTALKTELDMHFQWFFGYLGCLIYFISLKIILPTNNFSLYRTVREPIDKK